MKEYTGGSVSYYSVEVANPTTEGRAPYIAECNDLIEALGMNYAEGNAFKAIWRRCAARMGKSKDGYKDGLYDAEKVVFFGKRLVEQEMLSSMQKIDDHTKEEPKPAPSNDGWIEWNSGDCPVPKGTLIDVRHRDGEEFLGVAVLMDIPCQDWEYDWSCGDIIAYRLSPSNS